MLIHGQIGYPFYVLVAGLVKVTQADEDGHEKQLVEIGPGAYFGELGVLKDQPRAATVIAETKVEALCIEANVFKRWHEAHPQAADLFKYAPERA